MWRGACVILLPALLVGRVAAAELENENLLVGAPAGYTIGFQGKNDDGLITEWVPKGETVENWTEMLTVQVFYQLKTTPDAFMHALERRWRAACPEADEAQPIASGDENGYPTQVWLLSCPQNPSTGRPEITWFKAVQGDDSFYVVQEAFKFMPSEQQITRWVGYLKAVHVCDSRRADRACPKGK